MSLPSSTIDCSSLRPKLISVRVTRTLISLGRTELQSIVDDGKDIHIDCQFCDKIYDYTPDQVRQILKDLDG